MLSTAGRIGEQPQEQHLKPEAWLDALPQVLLAAPQLALPAQQPHAAESLCQLRKVGPELGGKAAELQPARGCSGQHQVPKQGGQALQHRGGLAPAIHQLTAGFNHAKGIGRRQSGGEVQQFLLRYRPQQVPDRGCFDRCRQQAELIEQAFGIPQAPLGPLCHHLQSLLADGNSFLLSDESQVIGDGGLGNAAEVEALAARKNRGKYPLRVGGGQHEHHPGRWLLQGLEQGIEGGGREHVALVDHIHLPARLHRGEAGAFDQLADVVDAGVGGGVDLDHIEGVAGRDRAAQLADAARLSRGSTAPHAVQ